MTPQRRTIMLILRYSLTLNVINPLWKKLLIGLFGIPNT